jgi:hypothetical protein
MDGGQGSTWRVGDVVVKPVGDVGEHVWRCTVYASWEDSGLRVPEPLAATDGGWAVEGWGAHVLVPGTTVGVTDDPRWFRAACDRFLDAVADLPEPAFLATRDDPWSVADRELQSREAWPVPGRRQVVHGDLTGNVLRDGDVPGVIDWPAYWWPRELALAVVVVDALCWQDAPASLLAAWPDVGGPALRRALAWRTATRRLREPDPDLTRERATLDLVEQHR